VPPHRSRRRQAALDVAPTGDHERFLVAQPLQAAAAVRPDAPGWDAQLGADLGVRHGRVLDEQGDQPMTFWGQVGEGCAQCGVELRQKQLLLGYPGLPVGPPSAEQRRPLSGTSLVGRFAHTVSEASPSGKFRGRRRLL
jgi:hypothetical protein